MTITTSIARAAITMALLGGIVSSSMDAGQANPPFDAGRQRRRGPAGIREEGM